MFELPSEITDYLAELDAFVDAEIKPIEARDDNIRFFDHRRENSRTDWDNDGLPTEEWEELLSEMRRTADAAGHYRFALPKEFGGQDGSNLAMAAIRHHLAHKGLGLHNDLQNESSIVGNLVQPLLVRDFWHRCAKARFHSRNAQRRNALELWPDRGSPWIRRHMDGNARSLRDA